MILITIQKLFAIQMLIGQDPLLIENLLLGIVSPLVVTWSRGKVRTRLLWQRSSAEYRALASANLFGSSNCLESYNLETSLKCNLRVTIMLLFILAIIMSFMRGPNTLRLIIISFEKRLCPKTSRLSLLTQVIN